MEDAPKKQVAFSLEASFSPVQYHTFRVFASESVPVDVRRKDDGKGLRLETYEEAVARTNQEVAERVRAQVVEQAAKAMKELRPFFEASAGKSR